VDICDTGTIVMDVVTQIKYLVEGTIIDETDQEYHTLLSLSYSTTSVNLHHDYLIHPFQFRRMGVVDIKGKNIGQLRDDGKLLEEIPGLAEHIQDAGLYRIH